MAKAVKKKSGGAAGNAPELTVKRHPVRTVILSVIGVAIFTFVAVTGYVLLHMVRVTYGDKVIDLDDYRINQNQTSIIYRYDSNGQPVEMQRLHGNVNRIYCTLDEMPLNLQNAFIALEDKRFEEHNGVDWIRFAAVFIKDKLQTGGSSITQQLVKNITDERDTTFVRKFNEICTALNIEQNFSKQEILEAYLNTLYLGEGCYGVKTAAEKYFGKEVIDLNLAECSCLAAITKAPYGYDPLVNPEANRSRQLECLNYMLEQGKITTQDYYDAVNTELILTNNEKYVSSIVEEDEEEEEYQSYYIDFIIDKLYDDFTKKYDMTYQQATQKIYYGGLQIYAALDTDIQATLEDVYVNRITFPNESWSEVKSQSSMTVMDYKGRVLGIIGGAGEKPGNRCLNRAYASPRQPGSSIKPISVYAPAINENKISWGTKVQNSAIQLKDGTLWPKNQGGWGGGDYVTVQNAIARSLNTVAARVCVNELTVEKSFEYLTEHFHISTAYKDHDEAPAPMATGAMYKGITTLEMTAAYATFGNGGLYYEPYCYYKVTNADGSTVYFDNTDPKGEQVIEPATADIMCELLQTVTTDPQGTGTQYKIPNFQTMGKTGTTDDDYDRWFAGGTPYYCAAVWYGYDLNKEVANVSANPSGLIFNKVFTRIHEGLEPKEFTKSGLAVQKAFCYSSGKVAGPNCTWTGQGWFKVDEKTGVCQGYSDHKYGGYSYYSGSSGSNSGGGDSGGATGNSTLDGILDWLGGMTQPQQQSVNPGYDSTPAEETRAGWIPAGRPPKLRCLPSDNNGSRLRRGAHGDSRVRQP